MRRNLFVIVIGLLTFLTACEKSADVVPDGQPIYLSVSLPASPLTRIPYVGSAPTTSNILHVDVWASTTRNQFRNEGKDGSAADGNVVAIHTKGHFQSGEPQLLSQAVYPPPRQGAQGAYTADPVYFVSMYPQGWTTDDGSRATYVFTGCEDVMFAPQVSGTYDLEEQNQIVTSSPKLRFEHQLTRFTVQLVAVPEDGETLQDVRDAWGEITGLHIRSYNPAGYIESLNRLTVDLSKGEGFSHDSDVIFSGQQDGGLGFFALGTDDAFPTESDRYTLTDQADSVAYVMCAPVIATTQCHEYVITVMTGNRGEREIELDLQKTATSDSGEGTTRGNHFLITLKFKKGRAVAMVAAVEEWKNGGYGTGNIED